MKRRLLAFLLIFTLLIPVLTFGSSASYSYGPSAADLNAINAACDYPRNTDYLDDYEIMTVNSGSPGGSVYCLHGLNDGGKWRELAIRVYDGTEVTVIARHSYKSGGKQYCYACCIFENSRGYMKAGWINCDYLIDKYKASTLDLLNRLPSAMKNAGAGMYNMREEYRGGDKEYPAYYYDGIIQIDWSQYYAWWTKADESFANEYNGFDKTPTENDQLSYIKAGNELIVDSYCNADEDWFVSAIIPYNPDVDFGRYVQKMYFSINEWTNYHGKYIEDTSAAPVKIQYDSRNSAYVFASNLPGIHPGLKLVVMFVPVLIDLGSSYGIPVYYMESFSNDNICNILGHLRWA